MVFQLPQGWTWFKLLLSMQRFHFKDDTKETTIFSHSHKQHTPRAQTQPGATQKENRPVCVSPQGSCAMTSDTASQMTWSPCPGAPCTMSTRTTFCKDYEQEVLRYILLHKTLAQSCRFHTCISAQHMHSTWRPTLEQTHSRAHSSPSLPRPAHQQTSAPSRQEPCRARQEH